MTGWGAGPHRGGTGDRSVEQGLIYAPSTAPPSEIHMVCSNAITGSLWSWTGEVAFAGGFLYRSGVGWPRRTPPPGGDTGIEIRGPAVSAASRAFGRIWDVMGEPLPRSFAEEQASPVGETSVWLIEGERGGVASFGPVRWWRPWPRNACGSPTLTSSHPGPWPRR